MLNFEEVGKILTCEDCKFYKPIDETIGKCFEHEVPSNKPVDECPTKSFQPKDKKMLTGKLKQ